MILVRRLQWSEYVYAWLGNTNADYGHLNKVCACRLFDELKHCCMHVFKIAVNLHYGKGCDRKGIVITSKV